MELDQPAQPPAPPAASEPASSADEGTVEAPSMEPFLDPDGDDDVLDFLPNVGDNAIQIDSPAAAAAPADPDAYDPQRDGSGESGEGEEGEEGEEGGPDADEQRERLEMIREMLLARGYRPKDDTPREPLLTSFDIDGIVDYIQRHSCQNVVVMAGAGISVSAGIPDFRSPGTGLYDNLQKYDLPTPQSVFELDYFRERPDAFYLLARELWPDNYTPTPVHFFLRLLHAKGVLLRCFTQNIDSLEAAAGLPRDKIVAAHGNFDAAHCIETGEAVPIDELRTAIHAGKEADGGWLQLARQHGGLVKPDIVFFGEQLPERFFRLAEEDLPRCDLLIVMGTSLKVQPFASLVGRVPDAVPRLLINRERVGETDPMLEMLALRSPGALDFGPTNYRDAEFLGDCDDGIRDLARGLGWHDELAALVAAARPAAPPAPPAQPLVPRPPPQAPSAYAPSAQSSCGGDAGPSSSSSAAASAAAASGSTLASTADPDSPGLSPAPKRHQPEPTAPPAAALPPAQAAAGDEGLVERTTGG